MRALYNIVLWLAMSGRSFSDVGLEVPIHSGTKRTYLAGLFERCAISANTHDAVCGRCSNAASIRPWQRMVC